MKRRFVRSLGLSLACLVCTAAAAAPLSQPFAGRAVSDDVAARLYGSGCDLKTIYVIPQKWCCGCGPTYVYIGTGGTQDPSGTSPCATNCPYGYPTGLTTCYGC